MTTVRLPIDEMGHYAIHLLLDRMQGGHKSVTRIELEPELVVRNSCRDAYEGIWSDYVI